MANKVSEVSELKITTGDKLMVVPNLLISLAAAIVHVVSLPVTRAPRANTLLKDFLFAVLRKNFALTSVATEQWMNPPTEKNYLEFAKKQGFQPDTEVLSSGLKLHWLGPKTAKKVILYCHGGGYSLSCSPGHFAWLFELQNELSKSHSVSAVVIGYTLAPRGKYPLQLKQAAESLEWLLENQGKKPSDIIFAGDSAGGNLALSLISHLLHPHPEIGSKITLSEPLAGAVLISPWTKFGTDDDSVKRNATRDMVTAAAADRWSSSFLGSQPPDNYNQSIMADAKWFDGLDLVVKDILIWAGSAEILIDSIEVTAKTLKEAHPRIELVVQPGASHEDFIIDRILGYKKKAEGTKLMESWISARL